MTLTTTEHTPPKSRVTQQLHSATVRLAGDSGDGIQLMGSQLTNTSALAGNDVATFPDYPAEIRAPKGTRAGVSGFQLQFAAEDIYTPGDRLDALVVMNPAALVTNIGDLAPGGVLIVNEDAFTAKDLKLAHCDADPLADDSLDAYRVIKVPMTRLTRKAVEGVGLSQKLADRCKNFFGMGLVYWLYGRDLEATVRFIHEKFAARPEIEEANEKALRAGWYYGETAEAFDVCFRVAPAALAPGTYKNVMGNQTLAWGLMAAAQRSGKELFFASYPITPASDVLHELARHKNFGVRTFQAEDEIAAMCAAIGASFGGAMAVTATSGPGLALKSEALGLAVMLELPVIVIDVQRGGPSTGLPTKTEQADLLQAMFGRNGESPLPVLACRSPADCFEAAIEAWRIAVRFMVPVVLLSDGFVANGAEPWRIPRVEQLPSIDVQHPGPADGGDGFYPYARDARLARPWALPGTPGLMHRVGGLEKEHLTGNVSYDPQNHQKMIDLRAEKVQRIAEDIPPQRVDGPDRGDLLVLGWGGTFGACTTAVKRCQADGLSVSHAHLRYLNPMPANLGSLLGNFRTVLIPELNRGQLGMLLRAQYAVRTVGLNKVQGKPFSVEEIVAKIRELLR